MRLKLFPKFFILLVILAIVPASIVGWRTININREGMQAAILELHTNMAQSLADYIENYLENLDRELKFVLYTLSGEMTWSDRQSILQTLMDTNGNFVSVSILNRKGEEILKAYNPAREKDPQLLFKDKDQAFIEFQKNAGSPVISPVYFFEDDPR